MQFKTDSNTMLYHTEALKGHRCLCKMGVCVSKMIVCAFLQHKLPFSEKQTLILHKNRCPIEASVAGSYISEWYTQCRKSSRNEIEGE